MYSVANKTLKSYDISQEIGMDELGGYYDLSAYYHILENGQPLKQQFVQVFRLYTDKDYALMGQVSEKGHLVRVFNDALCLPKSCSSG